MNYVIVKYAADGVWESYFEGDPKLGVHPSYSVHSTYTGKQLRVRSSYTNKESALKALKKMLQYNPSGYYDVCPVID